MTLFRYSVLALAATSMAGGLVAFAEPEFRSQAGAATNVVTLKPASDFEKLTNKDERAVALFKEAGKVIQSPRCMNCHPATERPTQSDRMRPHIPLVVRGEGGVGAAGGLVCSTCHHESNFDAAGVPGNPKWSLAPAEQAWQGKTLGQICVLIKDKNRNGGKDMAALIHHMAEDELVGWAWYPGTGRTPAPGTQKQFGELIKAWAQAGATCPSS